MSHRRFPQPVDVIRGRLLQSAPHNHPQTVSDGAMAGRAVNVVSPLPALDERFIHRKRERFNILARRVLAFVERGIFVQPATRDRALHGLPLAAAVGEEIARALRTVFRLILHVESRTTHQTKPEQGHTERSCDHPHRATSAISSGPRLSRNPAV
jgi:hypothetical protein